MAGGKGTRLRPLTCRIPKPMVPLLDRPCMAYTIELLREHGITQIAVTTQYMPEVIRGYFGDGEAFGVELHYFDELTPLGTAGSVKNASAFLDERFIVVSGDALTDIDLGQAVAFHERREAMATIVLTRVDQPLEYGVVMTDETGRISRFLEKPDWSEVFSDTVNTGIYVLEPEVLRWIAPDREQDFSNDLFPLLMRRGEALYGYAAEGYWSDVGSLVQYRQSQFDMLDGKVRVHIAGREVRPGLYIGDNVTMPERLVDGSGPGYIGNGTVLEDGVRLGPYVVLGQGNRIGGGSAMSRTIVWDHCRIEGGSDLTGATLCGHVFCRTETELAEGVVIGSHCTLGPKTRVLERVKVWPHKRVREQTCVGASIVWGDHAAKPLFTDGAVCGTANEDVTPEFAARFAGAYGASVAKGKCLVVASTADGFARLIRSVLIPALQAVGVRVVDAGETVLAAARFAVRELGADGGIHVGCGIDRGGAPSCRITCFDAGGLPIGKQQERKAENAYAMEDYGRPSASVIAGTEEASGMVERYVRALAGKLHPMLSGRRPRIVFAAQDALLGEGFVRLASLCDWDAMDAGVRAPEADLGRMVAAQRADFGVRLSADGQTFSLVDERGEAVVGERADMLLYMSYFRCYRGQLLGVPLSAPSFLDSAAEAYGGRVVRTKRSIRAVLEASAGQPFHPVCDALFGIGLLARNVAESGLSVTDLLQFLPSYSLHSTFVEVPWDEKGRLMRLLTEQAKHGRADLLDGIKVYDDSGWVLLLPESDEPRFTLIAHGEREETALALAERYKTELIRHVQQPGGQ